MEAHPVIAGNEDQGSKPSNTVGKYLVCLVFTRKKNDEGGVEKTRTLMRNL